MRLIGEIIACTEDSYTSKAGKQVKTFVLTVLDRGDLPRMKSTVDFMCRDDQAEKLPAHDGKLAGKPIEIAVTEIGAAFGGRTRIRGEIVKLS